MAPEQTHEAVVVGGGLVGSLAAAFLAQRGIDVAVYERGADLRRTTQDGGRSINLVITTRGLYALDQVGLREQAMKLTVPVLGRMIHALDGRLSYQPYGRDESECNYSVSRRQLNRFLIESAAARGARFYFERPLTDLDPDEGRLSFGGGSAAATAGAGFVLGADGAGSVVRTTLAANGSCAEVVELLPYGYKELRIPSDCAARLESHALHLWPRGDVMLMALPNLDGSFTVTLYLPHEGQPGFEALVDASSVRELFEQQFPDAVPLIPALEDDFVANPTGTLGTVRCEPWHRGKQVLLIGDAAHAIVPFFGQGMNCGFEDCTVLGELLDRYGAAERTTVFEEFTRSRKPNADAIAEMALDNFVEMRDRVGGAQFLLRKQIEHRLEKEIPREYRSRYSMVMYSRIPYRLARDAGQIQEGILAELSQGVGHAEEVDLDRARRLVQERLTPFVQAQAIELDYSSPAMRYEGTIYRPPSEAQSYILQATVGCSWNACTYCDMYRAKSFRVRDLAETLEDIERAAAEYGDRVDKVFVADGDALVLELDAWEAILEACSRAFPRLRRVSAYATAMNLLEKSDAELARLRELGLSLLYIGPESGDDVTLKRIAKGASFEDHVEAARKAHRADLKLSAIFLLGAGGVERSGEHAAGSARLATEMDPRFVSLLTLTVVPGTPIARQQERGRFELPDVTALLVELRGFVDAARPSDTIFRTNHASNYLPLAGRLPRDRSRILETLDAALAGELPLRSEWTRGL